MHELVVVALSVTVLQPIRKALVRESSHHSVIAALIDDRLIKVEQDQKALLVQRRRAKVWRSCHLYGKSVNGCALRKKKSLFQNSAY